MKIKTVFFPLIMVSTLAACSGSSSLKYISRESFIAKGEAYELRDYPYTKAMVKVNYYEKRNGVVEKSNYTFHYSYLELNQEWVADEEDGGEYITLVDSNFSLYEPNFYTEEDIADEIRYYENQEGGSATGSIKYALTDIGGLYSKYIFKYSLPNERNQYRSIYKFNKYGLLIYREVMSRYVQFELDPDTGKEVVYDDDSVKNIYSITYSK